MSVRVCINNNIEMDVKFEEFHKICRFCFKANIVLYSLFDDHGGSTASEYLGNVLNNSFGLEIFADDGLPQSICESCTDKAKMCQDFWNQCQTATRVLNTVLAEHLKCDAEIKREIDTEIVYMHEDVEDITVSNLENIVEIDAEPKQKPIKRKRKQPDYQHCSICGLKCRYLNRHIRIMHSDGPKYECDICKTYTARSKGQLQIHMNTKHINKIKTEFVCNFCERHFKTRSKLNNHMAAKHPARRHPCSQCHLVFKSERHLNRHQTIHTGERTFICEECGKSFRLMETLRNHRLRHFPQTVPCSHCDKMFYTKSELRNHEGIHTGQRPWQCDICLATFVASSGLTSHRNKHKRENILPTCKLCGERFNGQLDLRMHMNDHRRSLI